MLPRLRPAPATVVRSLPPAAARLWCVTTETDRSERLRAARLYFICDARPGGRALAELLPAVLEAGVDVFQLRDKRLADEELLELGLAARDWCDEHGALFIVNDRADIAVAVGADGVHVGQDDVSVETARAIVGGERVVGLSTHSPDQIAAARGADYIGVGPVNETPTKPGRPAVGVELVRHAAAHANVPFFAIGGIDAGNLAVVLAAGARRVAVLRAIADASDPAAVARELRAAVESVTTPDAAAAVGRSTTTTAGARVGSA
jgi:thiamine-phosphate pyrophosphorylase